ncbi:MAG: ammonium transporter [Candidatus Goldbacteria bacterium]|nr:ammonium transporter [Candidatus Goldiibacteriota bacterium]
MALILAASASIFADEASMAGDIAGIAKSIDFVWLLVAAFLVFFMQAGFAMVESGLTRAKNAGNILMKNIMDFSLGSVAFFAVGFGIMFGTSHSGLFGTDNFFLSKVLPGADDSGWQYAFWLFQCVFAGTAATIVSGAMAERTKFVGYLVYSFVITLLIYPVVGHWAWGGGWLSKLGFIDFAGSTVVHSVGAWAALMGAIVLGPRIGKYDALGRPKAIKGHNIPLATLGVFILWFGWFGFNPGSTLSGNARGIGMIAMNTSLAAAAGAIVAMFFVWILFGKPDVSMTLNGALAGLVAITAPCASVSPASAIIIGAIAGIIVVLSVELLDKVLKIDDPVGAVSVHGACGVFGTLAVGLFSEVSYATLGGAAAVNGLFFGGGLAQFKIQAIGVLAVMAWVVVTALALFIIIKYTIGLRVSREEELKGLDIPEHGSEAYSGLQILD